MVGGGIRERWAARREARSADAPARRPTVLGPLVLVAFFVAVVMMVVRMGGGGDDETRPSGSARDTGSNGAASTASPPEAEPTAPPIAPPSAIQGSVRSRLALAVYRQPSARGKPVLSADHGTRVMVVCHTVGQVNYTNGKADPTWARIIVMGRQGYVHVGQLDTGGVVSQQVPACT